MRRFTGPLTRPLAVGLLAVALSFAGPALAWQYVIQGKSYDSPTHTAADSIGDLVMLGYSSENERNDAVQTVVKIEGATGSEIWRSTVISANRGGFTVDEQGNPIVAGSTGNSRRLSVQKISGFTGFEIWRVDLVGSDNAFNVRNGARAAAVDPSDDVIVVGHLDPEGFAVIKLSGVSGAELWRFALGRPGGDALALAVDEWGDVIAVGGPFSRGGSEGEFTVVKLSGSDGAELWTVEIDGTASDNDTARSVVIDPAGDVIAVGHLTNSGRGRDLAVVKVSGGSGVELWRAEIDASPGNDVATSVALIGGDVIAAGRLGGMFGVVKLSAATGGELWRATTENGEALSVSVNGSGDVFAGGEVKGTYGIFDQNLLVVHLSGDTGEEVWRSRMKGSRYSDEYAEARSVIVTNSGEVVVAGRITDNKTGVDFLAMSLRSADGVNPRPAGAKRFILREKAGLPGSRRLFLGSRDAGRIYRTVGANPTDVGAALEITNPTTGEFTSIPLPARNWEMVRGPGRRDDRRPFKKWLYLDPLQVDGPCTKLVVQSRGLRVVCSGAQIPFTLDESPGQGSLEVRLKLGGTEFCWVFEGNAVKGDKSTTDGPVGRFGAHKAPAPAACPLP